MQRWLLYDRFSRFDIIPACVRQTDGQKCYISIVLCNSLHSCAKLKRDNTAYRTVPFPMTSNCVEHHDSTSRLLLFAISSRIFNMTCWDVEHIDSELQLTRSSKVTKIEQKNLNNLRAMHVRTKASLVKQIWWSQRHYQRQKKYHLNTQTHAHNKIVQYHYLRS